MSYYENNQQQQQQQQWPGNPAQNAPNNWDHQTPPPPRTGTTGPTPQDDFAFFYQFEDVARTLTARPSEVDRAYENLSKNGKAYGGMGGRREYSSPGPNMPGGPGSGPGGPRRSIDHSAGRAPSAAGNRPHSMNNNQFDDARGHPNSNLQNFYATQRHQPSRGSNDAEQMMQAKRRMAAQRERELRNLHTEQQYQRTSLNEMNYGPKAMSEEETRDLIARQRSALYGEGPFADKGGYVDETGAVRPGIPGHSGPSSVRGASPLNFEGAGPYRGASPLTQDIRGAPPHGEAGSEAGQAGPGNEQASRTGSTSSPQPNAANKNAFESAVSQAAARTTSSSPGGSPPRQEAPAGGKPAAPQGAVAPIGTRPSGTPTAGNPSAAAKRSTTPLASPGGWGRGNPVWGPQSSGLSATSASVWG